MWIKIEYAEADEKSIVFPSELADRFNETIKLFFGGRITEIKVMYYPPLLYSEKSSFENPIRILLSNDLKSKTLMPDTQIYQAQVYENALLLGPVIGLLLGNRDDYSPRHMNKYSDRFGVYNKVGGLIYAFSANLVIWNEDKVEGLYFNIETNKWEDSVFPLPSVIYRRDFNQSKDVINRLKEVTQERLFNSYRFSKLELFHIMEQDNELAPILPATEKTSSFEQIKGFLDKHEKAILKPNNLSRGRGICILEKKEQDYIISDYRGKKFFDTVLKKYEFFQFFAENTEFFHDYLIQKYINLAKVNNSTFDIRVVMQKKSRDIWNLSGIECRVANPQSLITNISRGGYALELDSALRIAFKDESVIMSLTRKIYEYSLDVCRNLDSIGEHFAEFGLDIGVDENQKLWLIEVNVFPSFKGFKKMDYNRYLKIRYAPLLYALSLSEFAPSVKESNVL